jgi:transcriptional regulator with XRE-family HTH domain
LALAHGIEFVDTWQVQVHDLIARGAAEARRQKGWTQEEAARVFRAHGLRAWRKGTVGQLEAGLRKPRLDELLLIARALDVSVDKLFPGRDSERVDLGDDAEVSPRWIREMLRGDFYSPDRPAKAVPHERFPLDDVIAEMRRRAQEQEKREEPFIEAVEDWDERHGGTLMGAALLAMHKRPSDGERHAAQRLGAEPWQVILASYALWDNHGFDEERDSRIGNVDELAPRSRQARRGLVAREMLAELRAFFGEIEEIMAKRERGGTIER